MAAGQEGDDAVEDVGAIIGRDHRHHARVDQGQAFQLDTVTGAKGLDHGGGGDIPPLTTALEGVGGHDQPRALHPGQDGAGPAGAEQVPRRLLQTPVIQAVGRMQIKRQHPERIGRDVADAAIEARIAIQQGQGRMGRVTHGGVETGPQVNRSGRGCHRCLGRRAHTPSLIDNRPKSVQWRAENLCSIADDRAFLTPGRTVSWIVSHAALECARQGFWGVGGPPWSPGETHTPRVAPRRAVLTVRRGRGRPAAPKARVIGPSPPGQGRDRRRSHPSAVPSVPSPARPGSSRAHSRATYGGRRDRSRTGRCRDRCRDIPAG